MRTGHGVELTNLASGRCYRGAAAQPARISLLPQDTLSIMDASEQLRRVFKARGYRD